MLLRLDGGGSFCFLARFVCLGRVCGYDTMNGWISQIFERFVVRSQSCVWKVLSLMMVMVMGLVVAVECRAPAFSQRQSRLRKADELMLHFRLAAPTCRGPSAYPLARAVM